MKIARHLASSTILCAFLTMAAGASGADTVYHGSFCNPLPGDVSKIDYNQFGSFNTSASTGTVNCGAATPILATINTVQVYAYDRHTPNNVSCTVTLTDIGGNTIWSGSNATSVNSPAMQTINFSPGVGTHTVYARCGIPAVTGSGNSVVSTYRIITP